jgi:tetratricopeptide (TPR) repeat protein/O-antigen ligase
MQTRLSLLCEGIIEAITLAAVVLAPLFFNTTTSIVFELDKAVLVRVLAWLAALAWLVQRLETRRSPRSLRSMTSRELRARLSSLVLPAALILLAAGLTSLVSIAPRISFWGSPVRAQGFYTILAYVVLFLAARRALQTRDQVARLITAVVVASLPVALYALAQGLQLDPIHWPARAVGRPSSSIGNPIFVGEYLVMVLPLTIAAFVTTWGVARRRAGLSRYLVVVALVVLMGLQLAAIVVVQSRGAFLGLLASVFYLSLLLAARAGNRRLLGGLAIAALAVVGLLLLINLPGSPLAAVREIPYVGRLAQALDPKAITGQQRIMQWEAGVDLVTSDPARLLVGYGPDATRYAIGPFIPAGLFNWRPQRQYDRVHNEFLDILAAGGLVSLAAYLFLFLSAMRLGLTGLGLLGHRPREAWLLAAFSLGGGLLAGVTVWVLTRTPAFLAPIFVVGLVLGLTVRLLVHTTGPRAAPLIKDEDRQLLTAGLLAALVGHLVALQFSFGVVVTRTLFWIDLALLAALVAQGRGASPSAPPSGRRRRRRRRPAPDSGEPVPVALLESVGEDRLARSLLLGLILGVLLADFLLTGVDLLNPTLVGLVGITWIVGGVLTLTGDGLKLDRSGLTWPVLSLGWGLLFPFLLALIRLRPVLDPTAFYLLFLAWLGLTLAGLALVLSRARSRRLPLWRSGRWPLYLCLILVTGLAIFLTNVNVIRADINLKMAQIQHDAGWLELSIAFHHRALALMPDHDGYHLSLAQTYLEQAQTTPDANQRVTALEEALQTMSRATELAPLDATHFWNLGLLHQIRAEQTADPAGRRAWLEQGLDSLHRATALEPNRADLYVEQARVYLALERYEEAIEASRQALARNDRSAEAYALLGDAYLGLGQLALAEESYRQALELKPDTVEAQRGLAALYLDRGEPEEARDEALAALRVAPNDYAALKTLALAHRALGSIQEALNAAHQARDFAPPSQWAALETLIAELEEAQAR